MMLSTSQAKLDIKGCFCVRRKPHEDLKKEVQEKGKVVHLEDYNAVIKTYAETHDLVLFVENQSADKQLNITFHFSELQNFKLSNDKKDKSRELSLVLQPKENVYKFLEAVDVHKECKAKFSFYCSS